MVYRGPHIKSLHILFLCPGNQCKLKVYYLFEKSSSYRVYNVTCMNVIFA